MSETDYERLAIDDLLSLCVDGQADLAFRAALAKGDLLALAAIGCLERPHADRLRAILDKEDGPVVGTSVAITVLTDSEAQDTARQMVYEVVTDSAPLLPLTDSQLGQVKALFSDIEAHPDHRHLLLRWIAANDGPAAEQIAQTDVEAAQVQDPDDLLNEELQILAQLDWSAQRRGVVISYAKRCADEGLRGAACQALSHLAPLDADDVEPLLAVLTIFGGQDWAPTASLRGAIVDMPLEQARRFSAASDDRAWFTEYLLPAIFQRHGTLLLESLGDDQWSVAEAEWLAGKAPWHEQGDQSYEQLLHEVGDHPQLGALARDAIARRCMELAGGDDQPLSRMPTLGARLLLSEALADRLPPNEELIEIMSNLSPAVRLAVYRAVNWRQPERAKRLVAIVVAVEVADLEALADDMLALRGAALIAVLEAFAPHLDEEAALTWAERIKDRPGALEASVTADRGANAVLSLWTQGLSMPAFRALVNTSHAETRLETVPAAVCDYANDLSADDRAELLGELSVHEELPALEAILSDRSRPAALGPDDELLAVALERLADYATQAIATDRLVAIIAPVCREHTSAAVRQTAYATVAKAPPNSGLVALLLERSQHETDEVRGDAESALAEVASQLDINAADENNPDALGQLELLTQASPTMALPHARRFIQDHRQDHRALAVRILGEHGDRGVDATTLEALTRNEPNPELRREAERSLRRLTVGTVAAAHERLGELAGIETHGPWLDANPEQIYGERKDALVRGLDRVAQNRATGHWGTAIDQLGEVAKVILYRAIELGDESLVGPRLHTQVAGNTADFGRVLNTQQLTQNWPWVHHLAALYDMRTEHLTGHGSHETPREQDSEDFALALRLFRNGAGPCCLQILDLDSQPRT